MSHFFSSPTAGLRRITLDFSHLMKCSAESIHKYRVEGFLFPFPASAETDYRQTEVPKHRKKKTKNQIPYSESDKSQYKKNCTGWVFWGRRGEGREEQSFLKIKTMRRPLSRCKLKKNRCCCFCFKELKSHFLLLSYNLSLFLK